MRAYPVRDEEGYIVGIVEIVTDITARKMAEETLQKAHDELEMKVQERTAQLAETNRALIVEIGERRHIERRLRESEETYRLLFELNLAGVFRSTLDPFTLKQKRIECNDAFARILGYSSRGELIGRNVMKIFPSKTEWKSYIQHLLDKENLSNYEVCLLRKDRQPAWVILNATVRNMKGSDELLVEGTMVDITPRKEAEKKIYAAHEKLRAMASEIIQTEERERQHIATVLHDTVAQTLAAAKMRVESLTEHIPPKGLKAMNEARCLLNQSIQQTRTIMAELSPPILYELGFVPALEWLTERMAEQYNLTIHFAEGGDLKPLSHDVEVLLFQSTRELLMNVAKHSRTTKASITVSESDTGVRVEVRDDGIGFEKTTLGYREDLNGGFGLFSIRERLKFFGGHLDIQSSPGKGTTMVLNVPPHKIKA